MRNNFWSNPQLPSWVSTWISLAVLLVCLNIFALVPPVNGKKCPGKCIQNTTECKEQGGKIAGYCTNELACCDYSFKKIGTCGSKMSKLNTAVFQSPDYPDNSSGDLVCQFDFVFGPNATGIAVEFSDVLMDGRGFVKHSSCESDMFMLKGFPDWTPPAQCGNMTNYAAVVDLGSRLTKGMKTLTILALMSSHKYRWNIKVTQLFHHQRKVYSVVTPEENLTTTEGPTGREEESSTEDSPYNPSGDNNDEKAETHSSDNDESEQEEIARIMQLASKAKVPRIKADTGVVTTAVDEGQDYNYPEEETFIVNGDDTEISEVPWQASLRTIVSPRMAKLLPQLKLKNCTLTEGLHFCGGSIISDQHILSATHCFLVGEKLSTWQRLTSMKVVLGDTSTCDENPDGVQEFSVDKVYYHYAYDTESIMNDLVVIKLNKKIRFTSKVQMVKMAEEGMDFQHKVGLASGWGLTNLTSTDEKKKKTPEQLQSADDMFIGNSSYCMTEQLRLYPQIKSQSLVKYPKYKDVFASLICTYVRNGTVPRVVGQGDSGGPLVVNMTLSSENGNKKGSSSKKPKRKTKSGGSHGKMEPVLVGVISYMIPIPHEEKTHDVSNYVDFYQSVPYFRKWIDLAMQ